MVEITRAVTEEELEKANQLNWEYLSWCIDQSRDLLGGELDINEHYKNSLNDQTAFLADTGRFLLAKECGIIGGTACLKKIRDDSCEIKRLYVHPEFRGRKVGEKLVARLIQEAKIIGYSRILLDSDPYMTKAHSIYRSFGFIETEPYSESEMDGTEYAKNMIYMELLLR
jgi:GNAT superfamily N-acetyltransferase